MTTVNPTQSLQALRNNTPKRTCPGECIQAAALQRLAPGVVDGPYTSNPSGRERLARALLLGVCVLAVVVVLIEIARVLS